MPEIALTPQTIGHFVARFGGPQHVAVMHYRLKPAQRHDQWRRIARGDVKVVIGTRGAVFAPLPRPGVIIVDEEHENVYKQDQLPRFHARDVAIKRAQLLGIPVLLGSATPSLESYYNAAVQKKYHLVTLPRRVGGLTLPKVEIVDLREERRKRYEYSGKGGVHLLSLRLELNLRQAFKAGGQAILLLNRRGYANYVSCPDHNCGWIQYCDYCDAAMVFHKDPRLNKGGNVRCHHCQAEQLVKESCPQCGKRVTLFGLGTQRVEEEIARKFPEACLLRMDSDTMRHARDYQEALARFREGKVDLLVGTQMIGKGLDFPNVRVVGVVSADTALYLPDFRAAERTFQLVSQVAGRCGRGEHPGVVIVQTFNPQDEAIVSAAQHDYDGFAARELALREQVGLPPISRMARIVVRDRDHVKCFEQAKQLAEHLAQARKQLSLPVRVRGPAPCAMARVAEYYRQQIVLIAAPPDAAGHLQQLLTALRNARLLKSDAHTAVDVDPVALL